MLDNQDSFISPSFLRSIWATDYEAFKGSHSETALLERLQLWRDRIGLKETAAQQAFVELFFRDTWGYFGDGQEKGASGFTLYPNYPIKGAGQGGKTGLFEQSITELEMLEARVEGRCVIEKVFVPNAEIDAVACQWAIVAMTFEVSERTTSKRLVDALRSVIPASDKTIIDQLSELLQRLKAVSLEVIRLERQINEKIYKAFNLSSEEIRLVERG